MTGDEVLTAEEMTEADRLAVKAGVPSLTLMENAGRAVAEEAARMVTPGARIAVLCGPGNNGGDGYVAARILQQWGYEIALFALRPPATLKGDARVMAERWTAPAESVVGFASHGAFALVIDALYGAGFKGPVRDDIAAEIGPALAAAACAPILAVDVPSCLDATTGERWPPAPAVQKTVTFFRLKTGHLLQPGRQSCGEIVVRDIAIPNSVLAILAVTTARNGPPAARAVLPRTPETHKYTRGHAIVVSGPAERTGAARLGARSALRAGAGLVTLASPRDAVAVNAAHLTAVMIEPFDAPGGLAQVLVDRRRNAVLIGPGSGVGEATRTMVTTALGGDRAVVLDADALTSFENEPAALFDAIHLRQETGAARVVLTPHEGEFGRLFPAARGSKLDRAREAARLSGAVVVLKGPDTVIAHPSGLAVINDNAPVWLATAGSGDVLAGFITGLLAQSGDAWLAARAGVWLHGQCARLFGPGLIAEDLPEMLPQVFRALHQEECRR